MDRRKGGAVQEILRGPQHLAVAASLSSGLIHPFINLFIKQPHCAHDIVDWLCLSQNSYKQNNCRLHSTLITMSKEKFQRS